MKKIQLFENFTKSKTIKINNKDSYEDNLSNFMFELMGEFGGGLIDDYLTDKEITKIENLFKKYYDAHNELLNEIKSLKPLEK